MKTNDLTHENWLDTSVYRTYEHSKSGKRYEPSTGRTRTEGRTSDFGGIETEGSERTVVHFRTEWSKTGRHCRLLEITVPWVPRHTPPQTVGALSTRAPFFTSDTCRGYCGPRRTSSRRPVRVDTRAGTPTGRPERSEVLGGILDSHLKEERISSSSFKVDDCNSRGRLRK